MFKFILIDVKGPYAPYEFKLDYIVMNYTTLKFKVSFSNESGYQVSLPDF